jgi:hypothetical protein
MMIIEEEGQLGFNAGTPDLIQQQPHRLRYI